MTSATFDYEKAIIAARSAIAANPGALSAWGVDRATAAHDLATIIFENHASYDPAKSQYSTWATTVAKRRLLDKMRSANSKINKSISFVGTVPDYLSQTDSPHYNATPDITILSVAGVARAQAAIILPIRRVRIYSPSSMCAISVVRQWKHLSRNGVLVLAAGLKPLRDVLMMNRLPTRMNIQWFEILHKPLIAEVYDMTMHELAGD